MPTEIVIRPATTEDFEGITRVTLAAYRATGYFDPDSTYFDFIADTADRAQHAELFVAERDGQLIASISVIRPGSKYADICRDDELEMRMLAVDPHIQRSGSGRALVRAVVALGEQDDAVARLALTTGGSWAPARALYESEGFTHVPERDWFVPSNGAPLVVYTKDV
ncbi:GNAT family N-acetyltransferase [Zhihengliuella flava]|uniref:Ribosomal protein S18 acetylase RimI-like enzyme n=1 Tax=Zhihengliuella flava TaxID=1285193 RepID=A0A931D7M4_9MICC|nr:GNAT family N-acetyltransferase [Zhihengliuella flava]MBG6083904.1 ribosomal protein S18 acetylase RimI-like enzyme [Zhihengliuella flava]